jgi:hypothetical protein
MDVEFDNLADVLTQLPRGTPFFVSDEVLAIWFPPWTSMGNLDPESLDAAERFGERFGCTITHDAHMGQWCFTKPPPPSN